MEFLQLFFEYLSYDEVASPSKMHKPAEYIMVLPSQIKDRCLASILKDRNGTYLVFTQRIEGTLRLKEVLKELGFKVYFYHSSLNILKRKKALTSFKRAKEGSVLIATEESTVPHADIVINYDTPTNSELYTQHLGRVGRDGRAGISITFDNRYMRLHDLIGSGRKLPQYQAEKETVALQLKALMESVEDLLSVLKEMIPEHQERFKKLKKEHGSTQLGNITTDMVLGGMRGMIGMLWETSMLDQEEGIRFRGLSIPECRELLQTAKPGKEPLPEGLLWLLLTGMVPSKEQVDALSKELHKRASVPDFVYKAVDVLPVYAHPMTQFSAGVLALQVQSKVHKEYEDGIPKSKLWEPTYEDCLNLIAQVPVVAAYVYRRIYKDGQVIPADDSLDYGGNFAHMLGFDDPQMRELMRLYITIHSDHEGGNVSAYTAHLVASALSDPYLSFAAALNGLAGPLHGLANQILPCPIWSIKEHWHLLSVDMGPSLWTATREAKECYYGVARKRVQQTYQMMAARYGPSI